MSSRYYERDYGRDYGRYDQSERDYGRKYGRNDRGDYGESRYGRGYDYFDDTRGSAGREGRDFTERASDEVRSWFGDEDAERRRRRDEQRYGRESYGHENYGRESYGSGHGDFGGYSGYGGQRYSSRTYAGAGRENEFGENSILVKLGDTNFDISGGEDIRGRRVLDENGNDIGDVNDLIVDGRQRRVRFLQVTSGGFLGIGATMMLVPVGAITNIRHDAVEISRQGGRGLGGVRYEPTLTERRGYTGEYEGSYGGYSSAGQRRGRGPRGYKRSDERIREDVNDRLSDDHFLDASDIEVSVSNGEVTLSGTVNSRADKRRAEDIAESVSAVTHVQNSLRVNRGELAAATGSTASTPIGTARTGTTDTTTGTEAGTTTTTGARRGTAAGGSTT